MSFLARFLRKPVPALPAAAPRRVVDEIVGELKFDGELWFTGSLPHDGSCLPVIIAASGPDIEAACLATARRVWSELPVMIERAFRFLATFPGFRGIERVRAIFVLSEVVIDGEKGSFYLVFHCTEDRNPKASWRVHFRNWLPFSQGRDS